MIEKSVVRYLVQDSLIVAMLGGPKVFYQRAPSSPSILMPWIVVAPGQGSERKRLTNVFVEPRTRLTVEVNTKDPVEGLEIANLVLARLDFYRGDMSDSRDVYLRCSAPFAMDGFAGVSRHIIPVIAKDLQTISRPVEAGS